LRYPRNGRTSPLRVIAGQYRSRPLRSLPGPDIRPTTDRLRATLFNVLTAGNPNALAGSVWADLYAGTGAVGIEALSRGAGHVHFVESSRAAVNLIRKNLESLKIDKGFDLLQSEVRGALRTLQARDVRLDYVFLDPPYKLESEYEHTVQQLGDSALLKGGSIVIAEHSKKFGPLEAVGRLKRYRMLVQGDAALSFYSTENWQPTTGN
jgi:16S rRNA (guanine966-N2)-methyltransferase